MDLSQGHLQECWSDRGQRLLGRKGHSSKTALLSESRADDGLELWIQEPQPQMNGPRDKALRPEAGGQAEGTAKGPEGQWRRG